MFFLYMNAANKRMSNQMDMLKSHAWHVAYFSRTNKFPKHEELFEEDKKKEDTLEETILKIKLIGREKPKKTWAEFQQEFKDQPR